MARLFVPREPEGEARVAATPDSVARLVDAGYDTLVEHGAGERAGVPDERYEQAGARIAGAGEVAEADVIARVTPPSEDEVAAMRQGAVLLSFIAPHRDPGLVEVLARQGVSVLAMDLVPRISRAQSIDALSSQANLAGYRAVIVAAYLLDKHFPLFMTAAGTIRPAQVVVLGAGVAGLQAVATAKRLGAVVKVSDVREAAKSEVASLGASFIDVPEADDLADAGGYAKAAGEDFLERQRAVLTEAMRSAHAVIATAQIPLRAAPLLVTREMVEAMPPGSVVIDLAAADGGNCELTRTEGTVEHDGVRVVPGHDLPSQMPGEASAMYAGNVATFLSMIVADGQVVLDLEDEVVAGTLLVHGGEVVNERVRTMLDGGGS